MWYLFKGNLTDLYIVSFVFYEGDDISDDIAFLNEKLKTLGHKNMVHTALLVARKNEYNKYSLERRKNIFYALFNFARKVKVKFNSFVIDKRYINSKSQLKRKIKEEINDFLRENHKYLESFDEVTVYYDNGQKDLGNIIATSFSAFSNSRIISVFNHDEERLFQVADMLTVIDKYDFKIRHKIMLTNSEKNFFSDRKMIFILKDFKNKRLIKKEKLP